MLMRVINNVNRLRLLIIVRFMRIRMIVQDVLMVIM